MYATHSSNVDVVTAKVDLRNAFNLVSRDAVDVMVKRFFPYLSAWRGFCYDKPSVLHYGAYRIDSSSGLQQGDPLAPLFFSLVLSAVTNIIATRWPKLIMQRWYLDDGVIMGSLADVTAVFRFLSSDEVKLLGLHLEPTKSEAIYIHDPPSPPSPSSPPSSLPSTSTSPPPSPPSPPPPPAADFRATPKAIDTGQVTEDTEARTAPAAGQQLRQPIHVLLSLPESQIIRDGNFELLGAPIGDDAFCARFIHKLGRSHEVCLSRAEAAFTNIHCLLAVTRRTAGFCKLVYFISTTPPTQATRHALQSYHDRIRRLWASASIRTTDDEWSQAELPVRLGGAGVNNPATRADAAYFSSVTKSAKADSWTPDPLVLSPLADRINAAIDPDCAVLVTDADDRSVMNLKPLRDTSEAPPPDEFASPPAPAQGAPTFTPVIPSVTRSQRELALWLQYTATYHLMRRNAEARGRLPLLMDRNAGRFIDALPGGPTHMPNGDFLIAMRLRLGQSVYVTQGHACEVCRNRGSSERAATSVVDKLGRHALNCGCGGDTIRRHNKVASTLQEAVGLQTHTEQMCGGDQSRPADVLFLQAGTNGKDVAVDVGIVYGNSKSFNFQADTKLPSATTDAERLRKEKNGKAKTKVEAGGFIEFMPIISTHFGAWTPDAASFLTGLATRASATSNNSPALNAFRVNHMFDCLSVCIQRQNALTILRRRGPLECNMLRRAATLAGNMPSPIHSL